MRTFLLFGMSFLFVILTPFSLPPGRSGLEKRETASTISFFLPMVSKAPSMLAGCPVLPANNIWNRSVNSLAVDANSAGYINFIGAGTAFHADFGSGDWPPGSGSPIGIPYITVPGSQPKLTVHFQYASESDPGPYPIPANPPIEGGPNSNGDRHILILDRDTCLLYELYHAFPPTSGGTWTAGSGATFNLRSNALRPDTWTSADAAGLPILPGLVRYDELAAGEIAHAIRFTAPDTRSEHIWPARHTACTNCPASAPPMGQRFRLKTGYNISTFSPAVQVILRAMKQYGIILADNGSAWYLSGAPDPRWNNDILHELDRLKGSDMEAVDTSSLMINPDSGQAR